MASKNYVLVGRVYVNSFALHLHRDRELRHQHDGGAEPHDHEDGSHLLDPKYER